MGPAVHFRQGHAELSDRVCRHQHGLCLLHRAESEARFCVFRIARKLEVVRSAVQKAQQFIDTEPEFAMASVCGLEIAAMAGFYHKAARAGLTIVLDGVIATAAALIAERLHPGTSQSMIAAHRSAEPGHGFSLEQLGLVPILENWEMRLGEGTGAILLMPLLDAAAAITRMATLQDVLASAS